MPPFFCKKTLAATLKILCGAVVFIFLPVSLVLAGNGYIQPPPIQHVEYQQPPAIEHVEYQRPPEYQQPPAIEHVEYQQPPKYQQPKAAAEKPTINNSCLSEQKNLNAAAGGKNAIVFDTTSDATGKAASDYVKCLEAKGVQPPAGAKNLAKKYNGAQ
jgi:hypothetical protein